MAFVTINEQALWEGLNGLFDLDDFKEKVTDLKKKEFSVDSIAIIADIIKLAIETVEEITDKAGEGGLGREKRKAVVKFVDQVIEFPFYLEWFDGPAIGAVVDLICGWIFPKK